MQAQDTATTDVWFERAVELLDEAGAELSDSPDDGVIGTVELALECLKCAWGDKPDPDVEDRFRQDDGLPCTCPPGLVARGGFRGSCPEHGR